MKISGKLNKEIICMRLDNIEVLYFMNGKYYFIEDEKLIEVIEDLNENIILQDFLFIPGKRIIKDSNNDNNGITLNDENYTYYNCKHFINKKFINRFKIKNQSVGILHYTIYVNRLVKNIIMAENFEFLIPSNSITPAMHNYFTN